MIGPRIITTSMKNRKPPKGKRQKACDNKKTEAPAEKKITEIKERHSGNKG